MLSMECLATFVVLFVLPLAAIGFGFAIAARRASARLQKRLEDADLRLARLEREARWGPAAAAATEGSAAVATAGAAADAAAAEQARHPAAEYAAGAAGAPVPTPAEMPAAGAPPLSESDTASLPAPQIAAAIASATHTARGPGPDPGDATEAVPGGAPWVAPAPPPPTPPRPPAPPRVSLEEQLGARLPVWIGAIALILAAAFLVKYSFDQGWVGPTVRVTLGSLFGIALLGGGELLRRSTARVAQGLTAAGVAVLFVILWAAMHLYQLIGPGLGFALLALTTATAVVLSLRQGLMVALLGLVGGFLTPTLVSSPEPDPRLLFGYLLLVEAGLLAVSRKRQWRLLAAVDLVAALLWAAVWTVGGRGAEDSLWLGGFLVLSFVAFVLAGWRRADDDGARPLPTWLQGAAAAGALIVAAMLTDVGAFGLQQWAFVGLLAAASLALARLRPGLGGLAWVAAAVVVFLLFDWGGRLDAAEATRFLGVAAAALLLLGGGSWLLRRGAPAPGRWAALAAASAIAVDLAAFYGGTSIDLDVPWGWLQVALAALWIALALPVARRRDAPGAEGSLAAAAVAATTFLSLAVPIELDREWISVAWAVEVAVLLWLAGRLRVKALAPLAGVVAALVAARLLLNPMVFDYPFGENPLVSWVLYGYGIPIAAFAAAAVLARRQGRRRLAAGIGAGSVALAAAFLFLAVRQAFHPGEPLADVNHLGEFGAWTTAWLALGCGLLLAATRRFRDPAHFPPPELRWGGATVTTLAIGEALLFQCFAFNPVWSHLAVGSTPVWNAVLLAYAVPALLLVVAARALRGSAHPLPRALPLARVATITSLLLLFLGVTFEVRQAFRGTWLDGPGGGNAEGYAYSAAWVALATALLLVGIVRKSRGLRLASLPVMLLAVGKVFLYDTAQLADLYRVFSFLGLGISLLFLAWVYQRFVFRTAPEPG
jgi:uncharacterized membrane protein